MREGDRDRGREKIERREDPRRERERERVMCGSKIERVS